MQDSLYHLSLIERGPFGALVIDIVPNSENFGKIIFMNKQFAKLLGCNRHELKVRFLWELQPPASQAGSREKLLKMAVQNKWQRIHTLPFQHIDSSQVYLKLYFTPDEVLEDNEGFSSLLLIFTEQIALHQSDYDAVIETHQQLAQLNNELKEVNSRLNGLLSTLGHDMKNYLGGISGLSKALGSELKEFQQMIESCASSENPEITEIAENSLAVVENLNDLVKHIILSSEKAVNLLNALIMHKALQAGKRRMKATLMDMEDLINDVFEFERQNCSKKDIILENEVPEETQTFRADPQAITQVLLNLLSNARKFTDRGGKIKITCRDLSYYRYKVHLMFKQIKFFRESSLTHFDNSKEFIYITGCFIDCLLLN